MKTKPAKKDAELRALLKKIVTTINRSDRNAKHLWDILSALRGPDSGNGYNKTRTTERIRHTLGFKPSMFFTDTDPLIYDSELHTTIAKEEGDHFADHIASAVDALKELGYLR